MPKLIKNTVVKVYSDPISCEKLEGQAKLLKFIRAEEKLEYWTVRFIKDGFKTDRLINVDKH